MDRVQNMIEQAFAYGECIVRVYGTSENPWFRGNDVARILEYTRSRKAIEDHVDDEDKMSFAALVEVVPSGDYPITSNKNELKAMYINESGVYSLIMKSRLPDAKKFKRWITAEVLPSIRRKSFYVAANAEASELKQLREDVEQKLKIIEEKEKQIKKLERKNEAIESYLYNWRLMEKEQVFYLATTEPYALRNRFEFGGVKQSKDLVARLRSYNTGRSEADLYFFTKLIKCNNYKIIEEKMHNILAQFKDKKDSRKEMIHLRYDMLVQVVDIICENYDKEIDFINSKCKEFFEMTIESEGIVPPAIELNNSLEITISRNGQKKSQKIDISNWTDAQVDAAIKKIVNICINEQHPNYEFERDKDSVPVELSWGTLTPYMKEYTGFNMTTWRQRFKSWFYQHIPNKLKIRGLSITPPSLQ